MTINTFNSTPVLGTLGSGIGIFGENKEAEKIYGTKPVVPDYPSISDAQTAAVSDNIATLPQAQQLTASINRFNQDQILEMLKRAVPGYDIINTGASRILESEVRGEIPSDVMRAIQTATAGRSVSGGFGGSGMARNLEARDLGLTSLDIANKGLDSASRWIAQARKVAAPESFDVSNMFLSPAQRYAADIGKFQRDLFANTVKAAPDPVAAGQFNTQMQVVGMVLGAMGKGSGQQWQPTQQQTYGSYPSYNNNGGGTGVNPAFHDYGTYDTGPSYPESSNDYSGYGGGQAGGWSGYY